MTSATVVGDIGLQMPRDGVSRALQLKREQLNQEIAKFTAQKEQEFREYEERLRNQSALSAQAAISNDDIQPSTQEVDSTSDKVQSKQAENGNGDQPLNGRHPTARQVLGQVLEGSTKSQREWEGVFTPEYLGLIDSGKGQSNGKLQPPAESVHGDPRLSSSATIHPPLIYPWASSPVQAQAVSSSAPEQSPTRTHHRSDSANSTLSVSSLRSSMKDPKTPKSPKRVLFSIEDGVVAPSSSPTLNRKGNEPTNGDEAMQSMLSFAKRGRDKKKKNRRKERGDGDRGRRGREEPVNDDASETQDRHSKLQQTWSKPILIATERPSPQSNGVPKKTPPVSEEYEKVDRLDDDDLFTFDEDLETRAASRRSETKEEIDDEASSVATKPLTETGTSPHAGSLPIEIKWPDRRDSGGDG